jgi:multidrug efflux pump subunit AcrA (membrane-fusion protein)
MPNKTISSFPIRSLIWTVLTLVIAVGIAATAWSRLPSNLRPEVTDRPDAGDLIDPDDHSGHDHSGHDHTADSHADHAHDDAHSHGGPDHEDHSEENSISLTVQARGNLGLQTEVVSTGSFTEYVSMPATIMDWPGRTHVSVTAPLTGVVSGIYVSQGELIRSGQALFTMRLTHQDLVKSQSEFLAALGRMDVENLEIKRLTTVAQSGAVARKTLTQREYERDKLLAELRAQRQAMLLHGLTETQIANIEDNRTLVREVTIFAPILHDDDSLHHESEHDHLHDHGPGGHEHHDPPLPPGEVQQANFAAQPTLPSEQQHFEAEFVVTELSVNRGQSVEAGQSLGRLSDYSRVLIEGHAFQNDAKALRIAANLGLPLQAVIDSTSRRPEIIENLQISYIGNEVELDSRALPFFVPLENRVERTEQRDDGRYVSWRFKPGQRMQLRVPLRSFKNTIVVPKDAVAGEGAERYVFVDHGDHLERRSVHVVARDAIWVAIKDDGSIRPGQSIAVTAAHQLQMAMQNKSGGAIDPHAGHNH